MKTSTTAILVALLLSGASAAQASNNWQSTAKDAWIDGKAETTLLLNGNLNAFDVNTDVENGKVTLTGKVENETEKALAQELVSVLEGVTEVDNMLTVFSRDEGKSEALLANLSDTKVATVIKTRLLFESHISGRDIDVESKEGVVTLSGTVKNAEQKQLAMTIADDTNDVQNVIDRLSISD